MSGNVLELCLCFDCSPPELADRAYVFVPDRGIWRVHTCPIHGPVSVAEVAVRPVGTHEED